MSDRLYTIQTLTGNSYFAGTDANVFVTLYGGNGVSEEIFLEKSLDHKNPFERGNTDTFKIKTRDLGVVYKIKIRHDNTGSAPGWLLNRVVVKDDETGRKFVFSCYDWLFKGGSEDLLDYMLESDSLPIIGVDSLNLENGESHHTRKFKTEKPALVIRRGQTFKLVVKLARDYEHDDSFYLTLKTGNRPRDKDKTLITIPEVLPKNFNEWKSDEKWGYTIRDTKDPKNILIEVYSPPNALPAKYSLEFDTDDETVCEADFSVYLMFNPWCKDDEVFMDDKEKLREYILKQSGQVYVGSWQKPVPREWYFGQFEEISLETAFTLLERKKAQDRDTAVEVSRIISSLVNSNDNNGVLVGNWSGEYDDGKSPTYWTSTPAILENFMVDQLPVKFGQCWVFSAIVTTLMRALGIPCRPVTNFSSAHDSDGNCSNDKFYDKNGEPLPKKSYDSVWNFHVWNDVWMSRPDLPIGYGGWQAIDATPQEKSQGLFQMGPSSLRAVKEGRISLKYDTSFVLAEVNADTIYWLEKEDGEFEVVQRNRTSVGKKVSTKAVGSTDREDITELYKFPEGSVLERKAVRNALLKAGNKAVKTTRKDIEVKLVPSKEEYHVGDNVEVTIVLTNTATKDLNVSVALNGQIVRYDAVKKAKLANYNDNVVVKGNTTKSIPIRVQAVTYLDHLQDHTMLRFVTYAGVPSTGQVELTDEVIDLSKPRLKLNNIPKRFKVGKEETFTVSFTNPIPKPLTDCEMYVDGSIIKNRLYISVGNVPAKETVNFDIKITADPVDGASNKSIIVSFCSKELGGMTGSQKVYVEN